MKEGQIVGYLKKMGREENLTDKNDRMDRHLYVGRKRLIPGLKMKSRLEDWF